MNYTTVETGAIVRISIDNLHWQPALLLWIPGQCLSVSHGGIPKPVHYVKFYTSLYFFTLSEVREIKFIYLPLRGKISKRYLPWCLAPQRKRCPTFCLRFFSHLVSRSFPPFPFSHNLTLSSTSLPPITVNFSLAVSFGNMEISINLTH